MWLFNQFSQYNKLAMYQLRKIRYKVYSCNTDAHKAIWWLWVRRLLYQFSGITVFQDFVVMLLTALQCTVMFLLKKCVMFALTSSLTWNLLLALLLCHLTYYWLGRNWNNGQSIYIFVLILFMGFIAYICFHSKTPCYYTLLHVSAVKLLVITLCFMFPQ